MPNPQGRWMYEANDGSLHDSPEAAKNRNGMEALTRLLREKYGNKDVIPIADVLTSFLDWHIAYLQGREE